MKSINNLKKISLNNCRCNFKTSFPFLSVLNCKWKCIRRLLANTRGAYGISRNILEKTPLICMIQLFSLLLSGMMTQIVQDTHFYLNRLTSALSFALYDNVCCTKIQSLSEEDVSMHISDSST